MSAKVLCVVDHFGSGGAQRQMVELACGLKERGHDVHAFIYFPQHDFFRDRVDAAAIPVHHVAKGRGFSFAVVRALARLIDIERFDAVVSFLDRPNLYAELATQWATHRTRLVVSERSHRQHDGNRIGAALRRTLHGCADAVVANSETHAEWLRSRPMLADKVHCIYNGVDLVRFSSSNAGGPERPQDLRLLAIGRVGPEKNALTVIRALQMHHERHGWTPALSWMGRRDESDAGRAYGKQVDHALDAYPAVAGAWRWLGERNDVPQQLTQHHALLHASLYEGLPNAVCEAFASARPVLASAVCDHPRLVDAPARGWLFDPTDPASLLAALESTHRHDVAQWLAMGEAARTFACEALSTARMVQRFEAVLAVGPGPSTVAGR
jgi:glycosyltransferase involved in cell wall biosynthesis